MPILRLCISLKIRAVATPLLWEAHPAFMRSLYELINIRQNMLEYVNEIIIFAHAANLLLMHYQQKNFRKRNRLWEWLFGSYGWVRYGIPKNAAEHMPAPKGYEVVIGKDWELIKDIWFSKGK